LANEQPGRLLVVEDNPLVLMLLATTFEDEGFAVEEAADGAAALAALNRPGAPFDALVTDIDLGQGPDGRMVAQAARRMAPELPVLFVTAERLAQPDLPPPAQVVPKPFTAEQLVRALRDLLVGLRPEARSPT
jgi:CheY-like chemotaxis protein